MARAKYTNIALTRTGTIVNIVPNATITVYEPGTITPLADTIYAAPTGLVTLPNPLTADSDGNYTFYLDVPQSVKIVSTGIGLGTNTNDFEQLHPAPEDVLSTRAPLTITTADESRDLVRIGDGVTYLAGTVHVGRDVGITSDPTHGYYQRHLLTGPYSSATNLVDAMAVEVTVSADSAADLGAILGVIACVDSAAPVSARALAAQLTVYDGALAADREAIEIGVHNALPLVSRADNRTTYDAGTGTTGILIFTYGPTVDGGAGGTAVDANTAIVIASTHTGVGFKQFEVFWGKSGVKSWQVSDQGNVVAGGGGNNAAVPAYGFLDSLGDIDTGTGFFWAGGDTIGVTTGGTERMRIDASGNVGIGGAAPSGSRLSVTGGLIRAVGGVMNEGVFVEKLVIVGTALAANTNNYAPSGGSTATVIQISASTPVNVTGLNVGQTLIGHRVTLINAGGSTITLTHNDGASSAGNQFNTHTGASHPLTSGRAITMIWNGSVWRFLAVT